MQAGKTIAAKRERVAPDSERERVRRVIHRRKLLALAGVVAVAGVLVFLSVRVFTEWVEWATNREEVILVEREPSVEVIDEKTGKVFDGSEGRKLSLKVKEYIANLEEEFVLEPHILAALASKIVATGIVMVYNFVTRKKVLEKKEPVEIKIREVDLEIIKNIREFATRRDGSFDAGKSFDSNFMLVAEGVVDPDLNNEELQKHFGADSAANLAEILFRFEANYIADAIIKLSNMSLEDAEDIIKN